MAGDQNQIPALNLRQLKVLSTLGRGATGVVFLVRDESVNGELFALKTILRGSVTKKVKETDLECISFEQEVLRLLQHPLLPKLAGVLATEKVIGYAIDYCPGSDLNCLRKRQTERMFSDSVIRFYAAELVIALDYLHGLGIVYRDLKPENVMIQENGHLMLVDFDLSTKLPPKSPYNKSPSPKTTPILKSNQSTKNTHRFPFLSMCFRPTIPSDSVHPAESVENSDSSCVTHSSSKSISKSSSKSFTKSFTKANSFVGTEEYIAPEMIQGTGHDFSVDWWCLGVVLHELLYGKTPFKGSNRKETFHRILSTSPDLVGEPSPLRDLIRQLLVKDPNRRISPAEIKEHEFFRGVDWERILQIGRPPFVPGPADEEDDGMDVNKIDIEGFVEEAFKVDGDVLDKEESHNKF